jgi:hypothetical protein
MDYQVKRRLARFKAIDGQRFQIGNNRGRINGWVLAAAIFGLCVRVKNSAQ